MSLIQQLEDAIGIDCLALNTQNQNVIASGTQTGSLFFNELNTQKLLWSIKFKDCNEDGIGALCFHPVEDHLLFIALGQKLLQLDTRMPKQPENCTNANPVFKQEIANDEINSMDTCSQGKILVVGDDDGYIHILDLGTYHTKFSIQGHDNICSSVVLSPYVENELFSGGLDCCVKSWDSDTGSMFWTESMKSQESKQIMNPPMVYEIDCPNQSSWDGLIAVARGDGTLFIQIEPENEDKTSIILDSENEGHTYIVSNVSFSRTSQGDKIFSAGVDKKLILWNWTSETQPIQWKQTLPDKPNALSTRWRSSNTEEVIVGCDSGIYCLTIN